MTADRTTHFFDDQFRRQVEARDFALNPFEQAALPYLRGSVLDYGCGLGNLALAAARAGCPTVALDAIPAAIEHIRGVAASEALPVTAELADLRTHRLTRRFDSVVSIGLLMFFDGPTADRQLQQLQSAVRPGGIAVVNVLIEGTTYLEMFTPGSCCLFEPDDLLGRFDGWEVLHDLRHEFAAPGHTCKRFMTVIARRPAA